MKSTYIRIYLEKDLRVIALENETDKKNHGCVIQNFNMEITYFIFVTRHTLI